MEDVCRVILLLLSLIALAAGDMEDSAWQVAPHRHQYTFTFHDDNNLILMQSNHGCYYASAMDNYKEDLWTQESHRQQLQDKMIAIAHRQGPLLHASTLEEMRDRYSDMLADFHCVGKDVFWVNMEPAYNEVAHGNHDGQPHHGHDHPRDPHHHQ